MADQRFASPVRCDVTEQAMFDLVPLAGSGGKWQIQRRSPMRLARLCNATFHRRARLLWKEQFFCTYGALNDKFGIRWMFQTDRPASNEGI
jgi:hypothetical protein